MGRVYRARHLKLGREVALKVIKGRCIDPEAIRRFEREMEILGRLDDPHLVRATDAGEGPDGRLFLVMDLVPGPDLGRLVRRAGPCPSPTPASWRGRPRWGCRPCMRRGSSIATSSRRT